MAAAAAIAAAGECGSFRCRKLHVLPQASVSESGGSKQDASWQSLLGDPLVNRHLPGYP